MNYYLNRQHTEMLAILIRDRLAGLFVVFSQSGFAFELGHRGNPGTVWLFSEACKPLLYSPSINHTLPIRCHLFVKLWRKGE